MKAIVILIIRILSILSSLILAFIITKRGEFSLFADYERLIRYSGFMTALLGMGFPAEILKYGRDLPFERTKSLESLIFIALSFGLLSTLGGLWFYYNSNTFEYYFFIMPIAALQFYNQILVSLYSKESRAIESNLWNFGTGNIIILAVVLIIILTSYSLNFGVLLLTVLLLRALFILIPTNNLAYYVLKFKHISFINLNLTITPFYIISLINNFSLVVEIFVIDLIFDDLSFSIAAIILRIGQSINLLLTVPNSQIPSIIREEGLQRRLRNIMVIPRILAIVSLAVVVIFSPRIFGDWVNEIQINYYIGLVIYVASNVFNVLCGSNGMVMLLMGYEKLHLKIQIISLMLSVGLVVYGALNNNILTVLIGFSTRIIFENVLKTYFVKKRLGINTLL